MIYFVYILSNRKNGTLYIGVTNNLIRRIYEHKEKTIDGFSSKYDLKNLVYYECFDTPDLAIQREKNIKKWNRSWKVQLISDFNPNWDDLYSNITT